jgi:hypothetical protein
MPDATSKAQEAAVAAKQATARTGEAVMDLTGGREDIPTPMRVVKNLGVTSGMAYTAGIASVLLSLSMWFFRRGGERDTAERLAIFVGLWPPTFMAIGKALEGYEHSGR